MEGQCMDRRSFSWDRESGGGVREVTQHAAQWPYQSELFKLKQNIEIQLVRPTELCGKV